jgi:hypothetical protein
MFELHDPLLCPQHRERMMQVMRYSGPKMMYTHPFIAIEYLLKKAGERN